MKKISEIDSKLLSGALTRLTPHDADQLIMILDRLLGSQGAAAEEIDLHQLLSSRRINSAYNIFALYINRCARGIKPSQPISVRTESIRTLLNMRERLLPVKRLLPVADENSAEKKTDSAGDRLAQAIIKAYETGVGRAPVEEEIAIWRNNFQSGLPFHEFYLSIDTWPEALSQQQAGSLLDHLDDGSYVQTAYEMILGRGADGKELAHWREKLELGKITREKLLSNLFVTGHKFFSDQKKGRGHDGASCLILGTGKHLTAEKWAKQAKSMPAAGETPIRQDYNNRFHIRRAPQPLVTTLASLYRGGEFIEQFMENITEQDGFDDYCELIIIDADSPEAEYETVKRYQGRHKNITYIRCNYRIGIYDAWNVGVKASQGDYLTNTNLDDLRRHDSLMIQAGVLENLPFVDVVYQDLYYTFDPRLSFDSIAQFGHKTALPLITPHSLINFNSPHNAPMWRKRLHDEVGYFNTHYRSAGDYEFWMRCLAAGKIFYKTNDPHVVYYQNPNGLSTRPDTRGVAEAMEIHKAYCRKLIPEDFVMSCDKFERKISEFSRLARFDGACDRYKLAHDALRDLSRTGKYKLDQERRT